MSVGKMRWLDAERRPVPAALRRRRRVGALLVLAVAAAAAVSGISAGPAAADSNGATVLFLDTFDVREVQFGDSVEISGYLQDLSKSCLGITHACDTPTGQVRFFGTTSDDVPIDYGTVPVTPNPADPEIEYGNFKNVIPPEKFSPGTKYIGYEYSGNFDTYQSYTEVHVSRRQCSGFTLAQSSAGSKPNESVTFTADLGPLAAGRPRTGTITIFEGNQLLASSSSLPDGRSFATSTASLPQGSTDLQATYSGDAYYEGCTSTIATHQVSADAYPTAVDDFVTTDVGEPVTINMLANDFDDGPSTRYEILGNPDFGDLEGISTGAVYTPDPDMGSYEDSFPYVIYDSIGQSSAVARVHIQVGCTPATEPDRYAVGQESTLTVTGAGVTENDDSCDGSPVSVRTQPSHGTLALAADGSFVYKPAVGYWGPDTFSYEYAEGLDTPVSETVYLNVRAKGTEVTTTTTTTTEPTTTTTEPTTTTSSTTTSTSTTTTEPSTTTTSTTSTSTSTTTSTTAPTSTTTTTTPPPVLTPSEQKVTAWYDALLGRAPDPGGLRHWSGKVDGGTRPLSVTSQLVSSSEFSRRVVRDAYRTCLGRRADAGGLTYWANRVQAGGSVDELRAGLLGSNEAWVQAGRGQAAWAGQAYDALLGRLPTTAERSKVIAQLGAGRSRASVAQSIATTPAARRHLAMAWYEAILGRQPTVEEAIDWAGAMALGTREQTLVAELASRLVVPAS